MGLATFLLGDVSGYRRYVSPNTDARERQWRWFFYAQDTWRATPKWTFNYGIRLEDIMPQTVNEPGNAGFFDIDTGEMKVAGVGGVGLDGDIENKINIAPRLGITYQLNEKTVIRMGYGRSYDIGVFGSTFGHSVTQNLPVLARQTLNAPAQLRAHLQPGPGPARRRPSREPDANGRFAAPDGVNPSILPEQQRLPYVDAWNLTDPARARAATISAEIAYVGNKGTHVFNGDGPDINFNQPTIDGLPRRAARPAAAVLQRPGGRLRRALRPDHRHALPLQLLRQQLQLAAGQADQALHRRLLAARDLHAAARPEPRRPTSTSSTATWSTARRQWARTHTASRWRPPSSCPSARASGTWRTSRRASTS